MVGASLLYLRNKEKATGWSRVSDRHNGRWWVWSPSICPFFLWGSPPLPSEDSVAGKANRVPAVPLQEPAGSLEPSWARLFLCWGGLGIDPSGEYYVTLLKDIGKNCISGTISLDGKIQRRKDVNCSQINIQAQCNPIKIPV